MILTTITPFWDRPRMLKTWLKAIEGASHPEVCHLLVTPGGMLRMSLPSSVVGVSCELKPNTPLPSIGHWHNVGINLANTEWVMKLDVDALPNVEYFTKLIPILQAAGPREWFNGGMFHVNQALSEAMLTVEDMPLSMEMYQELVDSLSIHYGGGLSGPVATNFICRKETYLKLGGCDTRFKGWGWEDYQQIYMLERYQRQADPLKGTVDLHNVTIRCRDEISRPKALELFKRDKKLSLLHCWHPPSSTPNYKTREASDNNRHILLGHILKSRKTPIPV